MQLASTDEWQSTHRLLSNSSSAAATNTQLATAQNGTPRTLKQPEMTSSGILFGGNHRAAD